MRHGYNQAPKSKQRHIGFLMVLMQRLVTSSTAAIAATLGRRRLEVMRVGFKAARAAKDYRTIIDVSAKVPDEVWQEDERLMMLHSMAETRLGAER